jgi:hypothetical protein
MPVQTSVTAVQNTSIGHKTYAHNYGYSISKLI